MPELFEVTEMTLRPIRTKRGHQAALKDIEALWEAPSGSPEADRLEVLTLLVEAYEREHYPIEAPDPIDFLQHVMEARGMARKDLEPYIGSRARVAEVLNRVRPLTLEMIRRLASGLKLPADVLIRGYELKRAA
jgi:HTH-type transcriptional regulator/antitoxin HigA